MLNLDTAGHCAGSFLMSANMARLVCLPGAELARWALAGAGMPQRYAGRAAIAVELLMPALCAFEINICGGGIPLVLKTY